MECVAPHSRRLSNENPYQDWTHEIRQNKKKGRAEYLERVALKGGTHGCECKED